MNKRQKLVQEQFLNDEEKVIKRLNAVYKQSLNDVSDKVKNLSFQIGKLQEKYDWLDENDPEREKVKSMIQSKIYQKQYQEQLHEQLDGIVDKIRNKQFTTVSDYLDECYTNGVVGTMFDLHGQGIPLIMPIDQESMVRAVQLDSKISKGLYTRLGEDVDLLKRKIVAQVSRGISTGMSYAQVAKGLSDYTRIGYNNAVRIARTEGHRIQNTAAMDTMYSAKEKGADIVKQWDSTLDGVTRESHAKVDGEIRELDKPFSNGLQFAGDPDGGAAEVVNCRCATLQRARAALDEEELEILKERAAFFGLDKSDNFEDFKKNYLKALTNNGNSGIIQAQKSTAAKYLPDYSCPMATEFGTEHYDKLNGFVVDNSDETVSDVWKKYEGEIEVGNAHYTGTAHARSNTISLDIDSVAKGNAINTPYQTVFHEGGHAIDSIARGEVQGGSIWARHYSSAYKNGLFPSTIKDEVQELVKGHADRIKAEFAEHAGDIDWFREHKYMYAWQSKPPKYSKSLAYSALEKEINTIPLLARADLSDILEGATAAKIQCGAGHGASYWRDRTIDGIPDGLATEAFAEMFSATLSNPKSLEAIKKYLPKSYGIFKEMLEKLK